MAQLQLCHEEDVERIDLFPASLYGSLYFFGLYCSTIFFSSNLTSLREYKHCTFWWLGLVRSSRSPNMTDSSRSMANVNLHDSRQSATLKISIPVAVLAVLSVACRFFARKLQKVPDLILTHGRFSRWDVLLLLFKVNMLIWYLSEEKSINDLLQWCTWEWVCIWRLFL